MINVLRPVTIYMYLKCFLAVWILSDNGSHTVMVTVVETGRWAVYPIRNRKVEKYDRVMVRLKRGENK